MPEQRSKHFLKVPFCQKCQVERTHIFCICKMSLFEDFFKKMYDLKCVFLDKSIVSRNWKSILQRSRKLLKNISEAASLMCSARKYSEQQAVRKCS